MVLKTSMVVGSYSDSKLIGRPRNDEFEIDTYKKLIKPKKGRSIKMI